MSSKAGTQNEDVSKLKKELSQIIECQKETRQLLHEKQLWLKVSESLGLSLKTAVARLRRQITWNLNDKSHFEKSLEVLKKNLKREEEYESKLKKSLDMMEVWNDKYKKSKESQCVNLERSVDEQEKMLSTQSFDIEVYKMREDMEKRLKNFDVFCAAMYSTFQLKESSCVLNTTCSNVKDAKPDHFGRQKVRKRRENQKKPQ